MTHTHMPSLGGGRQSLTGDEPALAAGRAVGEALGLLREKETRAQAARALARLGDPAAVALLDLVHEDDSAVRESAAWALGRIKARRWTRELVKASAWTYRHVAEPVASETFTTLRHAMRVGTPPSQVMAALALGRLREDRVIPELVEMLGSQHAICRMATIRALVWLGDSASAERLQDALDDSDGAVRLCALTALAEMARSTTGVAESLEKGREADDKLAGQDDGEPAEVAASSAEIGHD